MKTFITRFLTLSFLSAYLYLGYYSHSIQDLFLINLWFGLGIVLNIGYLKLTSIVSLCALVVPDVLLKELKKSKYSPNKIYDFLFYVLMVGIIISYCGFGFFGLAIFTFIALVLDAWASYLVKQLYIEDSKLK